MRSMLFLLVVTWSFCATGAAVAWNEMHFEESLGRYELSFFYGRHSGDGQYSFDAYLDFAIQTFDRAYTLTSMNYDDTATGSICNWLRAEKGTVVDELSTRHRGIYFNHCKADNEVSWVDLPISGVMNEDVYLIVAVEDLLDYNNGVVDPKFLYGWVHLYVTDLGRVTMLESAMGLDGQAMVVGEGAIPEPVAGSLLAMGLVLLALKRRAVRWL